MSRMATAAEKLMTVDEFLGWAEERDGRWELVDGRPIAMAPERVARLVSQGEAWAALRRAVGRAGVPCQGLPDGATVRVSARAPWTRTRLSIAARVCRPRRSKSPSR